MTPRPSERKAHDVDLLHHTAQGRDTARLSDFLREGQTPLPVARLIVGNSLGINKPLGRVAVDAALLHASLGSCHLPSYGCAALAGVTINDGPGET